MLSGHGVASGIQCQVWGPIQVGDWQTGASPVKAAAMAGGGNRSGEAEGTRSVSSEERTERV